MTTFQVALRTVALSAAVALVGTACTAAGGRANTEPVATFLTRAERTLDSLGTRSQRATWVQENFITDDSEILNGEASRDLNVAIQQLATEAVKYTGGTLTPVEKRKLMLLKLALVAPPPSDPAKATELSKLTAGLDADYGKGTWCRPAKSATSKPKCFQQQDLSRILAESRDPAKLAEAWTGWHTI